MWWCEKQKEVKGGSGGGLLTYDSVRRVVRARASARSDPIGRTRTEAVRELADGARLGARRVPAGAAVTSTRLVLTTRFRSLKNLRFLTKRNFVFA